MARYRILGPKGGVIVRSATASRVKAIVAALRRRFGRVKVQTITPTTRERIVTWARWGVTNEPRIHYTEDKRRDDWLITSPHQTLPLSTDCSGFATLCYCLAGAPDPNGLAYKTLGYTGTMLDHGRQVERPQPGDLVVYGGGTGHHVAVVVEAGADPLTVSHGQEAGPLYIRVSEEAKYQPAGIRYLTFLP